MRVTGRPGSHTVVMVDGGRAGDVPGDWSPSLEWLAGALAPRRPDLSFHEVRYRLKSWNRLGMCIDDTIAAIEHSAPDGGVTLVGFSMGGAVSIAAAGHPAVEAVVGLAPWIPSELDVTGLRGRRLTIIHGALDASLPGVPGITAASSRRGADRIERAGIAVDYRLIRGGIHPIALRAPWGGLVPAPRARAWRRLVDEALAPATGDRA
jgi:pimeloyl-ACP methyl ester carboxylesterase